MSQETYSMHYCAHEADLATFRQAIINIELTLNKMSGILEAQAKLEERTTHIENTVNQIDKRLHNAETTLAGIGKDSKWTERICWLLFSGILGGSLLLKTLFM